MGTRWGLGTIVALGLLLGSGPWAAAANEQRGGGQPEPGMVPPYRLDRWPAGETVKIVPQPDGSRLELHGDGVSAPYHWIRVPASGPPPAKLLSPYGTETPAERQRFPPQ